MMECECGDLLKSAPTKDLFVLRIALATFIYVLMLLSDLFVFTSTLKQGLRGVFSTFP